MERSDPGNAPAIIYEDNHLLAAVKPCGMPSQPDDSGDVSLDIAVKCYLKETYDKPGNVYLGLLHRLDRPTSGIVLLAKTDKAASRMAEAFRRRAVGKEYLALVECERPPEPEAELRDWLEPAANGGMRRAGRKTDAAKEAVLSYRLLGTNRDGKRALLRVNLVTGVKHQIRCQLAAAGLSVAGDFRYGAGGRPARPEPVLGGRGILLHAWRVEFIHPVRKERMELTAGLPGHWREAVGGMTGTGAEALLA